MRLNASKLTILLASAFIFSLSPITRGQAAPGDLDALFGSGGIVSFPVLSFPISGINFGSAHAVAIQPDGKIVVAGCGYDGPNVGFGLTRFNPDGSPDLTLGSGGKVVTLFPKGDAFATSIIIQPDGKIVAAGGENLYFSGTGIEPENFDFLLARYNADGSLDQSFGIGGKVMTDLRNVTNGATAIALQSDGKIVAVGLLWSYYGTDFVLTRYNGNGSLDFGITTNFGKYDSASDVAIQSDGKIIAAGCSYDDGPSPRNSRFVLARYSPNGWLDTSFGEDGRVFTSIGGVEGAAQATAVAIQPDGKIVAGGESYDGTTVNSTLVRYKANGALDSTFGAGGIAVTSFSHDSRSYTSDIAIQTDGKIVVAGRNERENFGDYSVPSGFTLARYNTDGSLDLTFGAGGKIVTSFGPVNAVNYEAATAIQPDGKIVLAGNIGSLSVMFRYEGRIEFASISGKVTSPDGSGLRNASVTLTDQQGGVRTTTTSSFGLYSFDDVAVGATYTIAVSSRRYRYAPRSLQLNNSLINFDFVGLE